MLAMRMITSES